jgi:hypothetical protein
MDDQRYCRLRVHGNDLDLAGPPAALRALAELLRTAGPAIEIPIRNAAVTQHRADGPLSIELRGSPTLHLRGTADELSAVWSALDAVATETESTATPDPHHHVGVLVITGERPAEPLDIE